MLKNNINFQVLPWPFLVSNLKVSVPYHFMSQMNKTCITQLECNIFIWMPYLTWSWPIAKQRAFTSMVGTFFIAWEAFWKVLFAVSSSFVTNEAKGTILNFNLWPDHDLTLVTFLRTSDRFSLMDFDSYSPPHYGHWFQSSAGQNLPPTPSIWEHLADWLGKLWNFSDSSLWCKKAKARKHFLWW